MFGRTIMDTGTHWSLRYVSVDIVFLSIVDTTDLWTGRPLVNTYMVMYLQYLSSVALYGTSHYLASDLPNNLAYLDELSLALKKRLNSHSPLLRLSGSRSRSFDVLYFK